MLDSANASDPALLPGVLAACGDHVVQFYESPEFLAESVTRFVVSSLERGAAVILVARSAHEAAFRSQLIAGGYDLEALARQGRIVFLDARGTLSRFMVNGQPDGGLFLDVVGKLIQEKHERFGAVQAYGEMVDVLRCEGNLAGMIQLEACWNDLAKRYPFSLLCGYDIKGFNLESQAAAFEEVCQSHNRVMPTECFPRLSAPDAQNRTIALLQRRAAALEGEIEERKRVEKALRESEASLREAIRARDEFLSIASHELKTPITSLKLQAQIFQLRLDKEETGLVDRKHLARLIETTHRQVDRLTRLVDDMLDISRISSGKLQIEPEEVDLGELVRDALDRCSDQLKEQGCPCRLSLEPSVVGRWDRYRLEQVFANLVTNAMKYAPGTLVEVSLAARGGMAILSVRDHGGGIRTEDLERIFDRYERAVSSSNISGLGLGLYICRQIVRSHGGTIRAESEPGKGAAFIVELPLAAGRAGAGAATMSENGQR